MLIMLEKEGISAELCYMWSSGDNPLQGNRTRIKRLCIFWHILSLNKNILKKIDNPQWAQKRANAPGLIELFGRPNISHLNAFIVSLYLWLPEARKIFPKIYIQRRPMAHAFRADILAGHGHKNLRTSWAESDVSGFQPHPTPSECVLSLSCPVLSPDMLSWKMAVRSACNFYDDVGTEFHFHLLLSLSLQPTTSVSLGATSTSTADSGFGTRA